MKTEYQAAIEALTDAIVIYDMNGKALYVNQAFVNLFAWTNEEVLGKRIDFVPEDEKEKTGEAIKNVLKGETVVGLETKRYNKDGKMIDVRISANLYYSDTPTGIVVAIQDLTELKKVTDEKIELERLLLQSEKMASIGQLAAGVAHEINNPTGFVSSNLYTLSDYHEDLSKLIACYRELTSSLKGSDADNLISASLADIVKKIEAYEKKIDVDFIMKDLAEIIDDSREGLERIKKIVIDLKDFAHPGEDELKVVDINKCIESTLNVVWNELKYKASIIKDYGELSCVSCCPQQINQVIMNILVNASQAIKEKGEIRIATSEAGSLVEIVISDNGCGIPEENLSKIFDPFFTTKEVGKGTGLGMNVAYNIIKKHGGEIDVSSTVGKGTIFTIKIPIESKRGD